MKVVDAGPRRALTPDEIRGRAGIVGGAHVVTAPDDLEPFCRDSTGGLRAVQAAAVRPRTTAEVSAVLAYRSGRRIPVTPRAGRTGMCGGDLAENAGGPRAAEYSETGKWVLGLEAVLADGRVLTTGGKTRHGVSGDDLTSLLAGGEGTLEVITKAWLRLLPKPAPLAAMRAIEDALDPLGIPDPGKAIPSGW